MTSNVMSKEELEEILKTLEFTGEKEWYCDINDSVYSVQLK
jgi:hypothetical protein